MQPAPTSYWQYYSQSVHYSTWFVWFVGGGSALLPLLCWWWFPAACGDITLGGLVLSWLAVCGAYLLIYAGVVWVEYRAGRSPA